MARIYMVHSFTQLSPELWRTLGHRYVMVSADDVAKKLWEATRQLRGLEVIVDSGGYRAISRGRLPSPEEVIRVQEVLAEEIGALPVALDHPVHRPLGASDAEFRAANRATARNARTWARIFGDYFIYPLHAHTLAQLREALRIARRVAPSAEYFGLGSLAPLARYRPRRLVELVAGARMLIGTRLHVFGVGNSVAALIHLLGLADSIDTSSPLMDARYGVIRDPETYSVLVVTGRKKGKRTTPREIASRCSCPVCRSNPGLLAEWGRRGVLARTLHNAYHLLEALRSPERAAQLVLRNRALRGLLARKLEHHYESSVGLLLPNRFGEAPGIGVDVVA